MRKAMILAAAVFCVATAGVAGIYASRGDDVQHTIKEKVAPDKSVLNAEGSAKPEVIKPMGDPSPKAEESTHALTNQSPLALLEGIFDARKRGDRAWLARTLESTAGKAALTEDDCHAAWRNYLWHPELWDKLEAAHRELPAVIVEEGDQAKVNFEVGGAAGTMFVLFKRINGAWYLVGA
jgi:hypothetical protein